MGASGRRRFYISNLPVIHAFAPKTCTPQKTRKELESTKQELAALRHGGSALTPRSPAAPRNLSASVSFFPVPAAVSGAGAASTAHHSAVGRKPVRIYMDGVFDLLVSLLESGSRSLRLSVAACEMARYCGYAKRVCLYSDLFLPRRAAALPIMQHYGHSNALRQARAVGDVLIVGLVADDEVVAN